MVLYKFQYPLRPQGHLFNIQHRFSQTQMAENHKLVSYFAAVMGKIKNSYNLTTSNTKPYSNINIYIPPSKCDISTESSSETIPRPLVFPFKSTNEYALFIFEVTVNLS